MAASTVAGGIFNAFAFAGASWIMSHIDKSGYAAEQKRHDLAEEELQREQDKWQRKTRETYERLQQQKYQMEIATHDLAEGDKALDVYHDAVEKYKKSNEEYEEQQESKPEIGDYYKPSEKMERYISAVEIAMIAGVIVLATKMVFLKNFVFRFPLLGNRNFL